VKFTPHPLVFVLGAICSVFAAIATAARAQDCAPSWSDGFAAGEIDGLVRCSVVADLDGEGGLPELLYIGGGFTRAGGLLSPRMVGFDGRKWHPLGDALPEMNIIYAAAAFDDGSGMRMYVGGDVKQQYGYPKGRVYCWNGSVWTQVGGDFPANIRALATFDDGSGAALYAGGFFYGSEDVSPGLSRWDGAQWQPVGGGLSGGNYQYPGVYSLCEWDDGSGPALYVGGNFDVAGEVPSHNIARWDGAIWMPLGEGLSGGANSSLALAMTVWNDGSGAALHVSGRFQSAGDQSANNAAKWDGEQWSATGLGLGQKQQFVNALAPFDDGAGWMLHAAGPFYPVPPHQEKGHVAYWDGHKWEPRGDFWPFGEGPRCLANFVGADPRGLYVGGDFRGGGSMPDYFLRRRPGAWEQVGNGLMLGGQEAGVFALARWNFGSDPTTYATGQFKIAGNTAPPDRFDGDRNVSSWRDGHWRRVQSGLGGPVHAAEVFDDGGGPLLYLAGDYWAHEGTDQTNYISAWDGADWVSLPEGPGPHSLSVRSLTVSAVGGPALLVGGTFTQAGNQTCNSIARYDGASWSPLGAGLTGGPEPSVNAMTTFDGGSGSVLIAAGEFTTAGDLPASNIAAWDGQAWSALAEGLDGMTRALCIFDDGSGPALYAGGDFTSAGGQPAAHLARWDGQEWSAVADGVNGAVLALAVFDDGAGPALYVGGEFTQAGGLPASNLARFDGAAWAAQGLEADGPVRAMLPAWEDGRGVLWIGGSFLSVAGVSSGRIARLDGCACYADIDGSRELDMNDFLAFQVLFGDRDERADCDATGTWDLFDFLCFVNAFNSGCP
jgi:prepilin-type processing-associated H-X9-DG protein